MSRGASRASAKKSSPSSVGAVQSKTGFADRSRSYWLHHRVSFFGSLSRLLSTPMQTLMTALVVAIALALPAILFVALDNMEQLGASWDADPKISVYIHPRARETAIDKLVDELERSPDIGQVEYLSAEQALQEFQTFSGFGQALSALEENPLPATLILHFSNTHLPPAQIQSLGNRIAENGIVDEVSLDMDWVRRLQELMVLGKKLVLALASLLGLGVLLAVGNTIRLAIENRREEILVTKLVGGTNGFVRRPFLYSGGWYGFMGGILACVIIVIGMFFIEPTVARLSALYNSRFELKGLGLQGISVVILLSTILGWFGAWLAVGRHLFQIEPK